MKILRAFGNYNASGIVINPGYYALAACLLCNMSVEEAIAKIILGKEVSHEFKPRKKTNKKAEICKAYKNGTGYPELTERFRCSKRYVWQALVDSGTKPRNDYIEKIRELMKYEPQLTQKEVALRVGCGISTASRLMNRVFKENGVGYFD